MHETRPDIMDDPRVARLFPQTTPQSYPRPYLGVRLKLAKEFADFVGDDRKFRELARLAGVDPSMPDANTHKLYKPFEIRAIRQQLMARVAKTLGLARPALMVFRIAKGGTGKTTTCSNIAACLANFGFKILLIDADSQGSASQNLGYNINVRGLTHIGHILKRVAAGAAPRIREAIVPIYEQGMLDLLPANTTLAEESWMRDAAYRETLFERLLLQEREFFAQYDAVCIDCAPGTSMMATTIMAASDLVTAIVTPEPQALLGLFGLESNLHEINAAGRQDRPKVGMHIVVNRYHQGFEPHNASLQFLAEEFGPYLDDNIVKSYVGFMREIDPRDIGKSAPLVEKEPTSTGARNIIELTKSLARVYNLRIPPLVAQNDPAPQPAERAA